MNDHRLGRIPRFDPLGHRHHLPGVLGVGDFPSISKRVKAHDIGRGTYEGLSLDSLMETPEGGGNEL